MEYTVPSRKRAAKSQLFDAVYSTIPAHKNHSLPLSELAKNDLPNFSTLEHPPVSVLSLVFVLNN